MKELKENLKLLRGQKTKLFEKSADHIKAGSGGSLKIHKEDGEIQKERTYPRSKDPKIPRDNLLKEINFLHSIVPVDLLL